MALLIRAAVIELRTTLVILLKLSLTYITRESVCGSSLISARERVKSSCYLKSTCEYLHVVSHSSVIRPPYPVCQSTFR